MHRRAFLQGFAGSVWAGRCLAVDNPEIPPYLRGHESIYRRDPHGAALEWFNNAKFGLMMHYGLYSQLGRGEWVMLREKIPVARYEQLKETFHPDRFDAGRITDLALAAGMKYVTFTSKHHEGFCLFRTKQTAYNSMDSSAGRDLVGELAEACHKKGLGLFLYYSYTADWHHPYFCAARAGWEFYRPHYSEPQRQYLWRKYSDLRIYIDYVHNQLRELLTQYGPLAGIWFDPVMGYYARPDLFPASETYALISWLQPQCLISFKQGANGSEDYAAPERSESSSNRLRFNSILPAQRPAAARVENRAWEKNREKKIEICNTLQPRVWGYNRADNGKHHRAGEVMKMVESAWANGANLLLNAGPLPDGSLPDEDVQTLREVGGRLLNRESQPRL